MATIFDQGYSGFNQPNDFIKALLLGQLYDPQQPLGAQPQVGPVGGTQPFPDTALPRTAGVGAAPQQSSGPSAGGLMDMLGGANGYKQAKADTVAPTEQKQQERQLRDDGTPYDEPFAPLNDQQRQVEKGYEKEMWRARMQGRDPFPIYRELQDYRANQATEQKLGEILAEFKGQDLRKTDVQGQLYLSMLQSGDRKLAKEGLEGIQKLNNYQYMLAMLNRGKKDQLDTVKWLSEQQKIIDQYPNTPAAADARRNIDAYKSFKGWTPDVFSGKLLSNPNAMFMLSLLEGGDMATGLERMREMQQGAPSAPQQPAPGTVPGGTPSTDTKVKPPTWQEAQRQMVVKIKAKPGTPEYQQAMQMIQQILKQHYEDYPGGQ